MSDGLVKRLQSLHKQATVERSHFYVGSCAEDAMPRIEELEAKLAEVERALDISCVIIEKLMEGEEDGNVPQPTQIRSYRVSDAEKLDAL